MDWTGGCLCGAVRYRATAAPLRAVSCHCAMCRRASGAAFLTFVHFPKEAFTWTKGAPTRYRSSANAERGFCARCGSTLSFARPSRAEIGVCAGTLDNPQDLAPEAHVFTDHQLAWLHLDDGLPRHGRFPPGADDREPE